MPMLAPSHPSYQMANVFLFLSYATTNLLALRICLVGAGICFLLWGWLVLDYSIDTIVWNGIFVIINLVQTARILAQMFPVKFDADAERIYQHFFAPGKYFMKRAEFKSLVTNPSPVAVDSITANKSQSQHRDTNGKSVALELAGSAGAAHASPTSPVTSASPLTTHASNGNATNGASKSTSTLSTHHTPSSSLFCTREFEKGAIFANPGDPALTLSILLSGRIVVEKLRRGFDLESVQRLDPEDEDSKAAWRPLNFIRDMEFLDSPEWAARNASDRNRVWEVRLRFLQPSRVFIWNASSLEGILTANAHADSCLSGVVGVDLARKIFCGNVERFALANLDSDEASTKQREEYAQFGFGSAYPQQTKKTYQHNTLMPAIATTILNPTTTTQQSFGTEGIHDHLYSDANETTLGNQRTGLLAPTSSTLSSFSSFTSDNHQNGKGTTLQPPPALYALSPSPMDNVNASPSPDHTSPLSSFSASHVPANQPTNTELPLPSRADLTHLVTFAAQSSQPSSHHQQVEHPMRARIGRSQQPHDDLEPSPPSEDTIVRFHHDD